MGEKGHTFGIVAKLALEMALSGSKLCNYSKANIGHSHWDEDDAKNDDAPYWVALVDEGDPVVNVGANVKQEEPEVW